MLGFEVPGPFQYLEAASTFARRSSATATSDSRVGAQFAFHFRFSAISFSALSRMRGNASMAITLSYSPCFA